jgi:hypothetical protein
MRESDMFATVPHASSVAACLCMCVCVHCVTRNDVVADRRGRRVQHLAHGSRQASTIGVRDACVFVVTF